MHQVVDTSSRKRYKNKTEKIEWVSLSDVATPKDFTRCPTVPESQSWAVYLALLQSRLSVRETQRGYHEVKKKKGRICFARPMHVPFFKEKKPPQRSLFVSAKYFEMLKHWNSDQCEYWTYYSIKYWQKKESIHTCPKLFTDCSFNLQDITKIKPQDTKTFLHN